MSTELRYYLVLVLRRLPLIVGVSILTSVIGAIVALNLPDTYRSESSILVAPPEIPENLAASTVQLDPFQEIEVFRQRLQTRSNLLAVSRQFQIFPDQAQMTPDEIVSEMRSNLWIRGTEERSGGPAILSIRYEARSGRTAANVVNELTNQIVGESRRTAAQSAEQTTGFFQRQVEELDTRLQEANSQILQFQNSNAEALPSTLEFRLSRQTSLQEQIATIDQNINGLEQQKSRLRDIFESTGRLGRERDLSPQESQLQSLREELASALAIYSEANPKVRVLQARIDQLESSIVAEGGSGEQSSEGSMLDIEIARIDSQIESEQARRDSLEAELTTVTETIRDTPANDIALQSMQRDYENLQMQYNEAVRALSTAQTGERIEDQDKGRRMTILEDPTEPSEPTGPNRAVILGGGVAAGLGLSGAIVLLLELLNGALRRPIELQRRLGVTPLATIPHIYTQGERFRQNLTRAIVLFAVAAGIPAALAALHYYYLPLDLLATRVIERLNL